MAHWYHRFIFNSDHHGIFRRIQNVDSFLHFSSNRAHDVFDEILDDETNGKASSIFRTAEKSKQLPLILVFFFFSWCTTFSTMSIRVIGFGINFGI